MRPPWRVTMRRAVASPTPAPANSAGACRRWKAPNNLSAYAMSNPAPLSLTKKIVSQFGSSVRLVSVPTVISALAWRDVNFQALPSRISSRCRNRLASACACSGCCTLACTERPGSCCAMLSSSSLAIAPKSTVSSRVCVRDSCASASKLSVRSFIWPTPARMR